MWERYTTEAKTKKSKAPVPVIGQLRKVLNEWRLQCGNPTSGIMFPSGVCTPLNLNNMLNRVMLPIFKKAKIEWHGWHAFRRGLATNLHALGVDDKTIQAILRHSNVAVTQACYIKTVSEQSANAMRLLENVLCAKCAPNEAPAQAAVVN